MPKSISLDRFEGGGTPFLACAGTGVDGSVFALRMSGADGRSIAGAGVEDASSGVAGRANEPASSVSLTTDPPAATKGAAAGDRKRPIVTMVAANPTAAAAATTYRREDESSRAPRIDRLKRVT